jgi:hypothetical protein
MNRYVVTVQVEVEIDSKDLQEAALAMPLVGPSEGVDMALAQMDSASNVNTAFYGLVWPELQRTFEAALPKAFVIHPRYCNADEISS